MSRDPHELATAYALDAVDDDERAAVEDHLAHCPDCAREVTTAREALAATLAAVEEAPPPAIRDAVLARSAHTPQERGNEVRMGEATTPAAAPDAGASPGPTTAVPAGAPSRRRRPWLAAAASFALVAGLGLAAVAGLAERTAEPTAAELLASAEMVTLDGADYERGALVRADGPDLLVAYGLPPLDEGATYQAWVVRDGVTRPAGLFAADDAGSALVALGEPVADGDRVLVSREPAGGSEEAPSGPVLMSGEVAP